MSTIKEVALSLKGSERALKTVLPEGIEPDRFMRTAINAIQRHPQQNKILQADRQSLLSACLKAAEDGLLLDSKEATLVVFKNQATYLPMTQGLVKLALNHSDVKSVEAYLVYQNDHFAYAPATDSEPDFQPDWKLTMSERGDPILAYAVVRLKSGDCQVAILHKERIMDIASGTINSKQYQTSNPHFGEWWKKTAIRAVMKYAPRSTALESAIGSDNEVYEDAPVAAPEVEAGDINDELNSIEIEPEQEQEQVPASPEPEFIPADAQGDPI